MWRFSSNQGVVAVSSFTVIYATKNISTTVQILMLLFFRTQSRRIWHSERSEEVSDMLPRPMVPTIPFAAQGLRHRQWEARYFYFFQKAYRTKIFMFPLTKKRYILKENTIGSCI